METTMDVTGHTGGVDSQERPASRAEKVRRIVQCLREDARMPLTEIARRTGIPVSTVFDQVRMLRRSFWFTAVVLDPETQRLKEEAKADPRVVEFAVTRVIA